jgi:Xaa-Pro aminopeptidase
MTDIENIIINRIDNALSSAGYKDILGSSYQEIPASFPWVFFEQSDDYERVTHHNSSRTNNFDTVVFEADIYSNKVNGSKGECKAILKVIDDEMVSLGFERATAQPMRPTSDMYKARLFARYRGVVDSNKYIYHT